MYQDEVLKNQMIEQIYIISYNKDDNYKPRSGKQSDNIASHVCMKKL